MHLPRHQSAELPVEIVGANAGCSARQTFPLPSTATAADCLRFTSMQTLQQKSCSTLPQLYRIVTARRLRLSARKRRRFGWGFCPMKPVNAAAAAAQANLKDERRRLALLQAGLDLIGQGIIVMDSNLRLIAA